MLVGTISIEKSEQLSKLLKKEHIQHNVLNAKNHEREAEIIAQAGKFGAVTISTNMAGRGTDIMLGGNAEFLAKAEMKRMQFSDELIAEATGFAETDNQEILTPARLSRIWKRSIKKKFRKKRTKCVKPAACTFWAPSATTPAVLTTSCAAVPAVRAIPVRASSTCPWRTI